MEKFNLEEYLKNPDREVVTRDGRPVRIICTDSGVIGGQIVAIVTMANKNKDLLQFNENGSYYSYSDSESENDLFFAPEKHEGWINIKKTAFGYYCSSHIFQTKEDAENHGGDGLVVTKKIEWEG